jgi:16S rRNA (cytosine1407-C5)-methyltransferase
MKNIPEQFKKRISNIIPEEEREAFYEACTKPLDKHIRLSTFERNIKETYKKIKENHFEITHSSSFMNNWYSLARKDYEISLGNSISHYCGDFYIQDFASCLPVHVLDPQPGEDIYDMAAAPGSKTTQIADVMKDIGCIFANEPHPTRRKALRSNVNRMGFNSVLISGYNATQLPSICYKRFDRVLLDAPCSGEGISRKDNKYFSFWQERNIFTLSKTQKQLIIRAFDALRDNGILVYSTCTYAPEENEEVLQHLKDTYGESVIFEKVTLKDIDTSPGLDQYKNTKYHQDIIQNVVRIYPHKVDTIGFFIARIRKKPGCKSQEKYTLEPPRKDLVFLNKEKRARYLSFLRKQYGLSKDVWKNKIFFHRENIFCVTDKNVATGLLQMTSSAGLPLMKCYEQDYKITFPCVLRYGYLFTKQYIEMTKEIYQDYIQGKDILASDFDNIIFAKECIYGQVVLRYQGKTLGLGLYSKERIKNQIPPRWRIL